jgi:hypothetical protein
MRFRLVDADGSRAEPAILTFGTASGAEAR